MILQSSFPNGYFGDPALYVSEMSGGRALLFDCGDLTRFSNKQLLKVTHIFLSHCHMDHFLGFDLFLKIHISASKIVTILGPPQTILRVEGKLSAYTWNLIHDKDLEFNVIELDVPQQQKRSASFRARDGFHRSEVQTSSWNPTEPAVDFESYRVFTAQLDHRTPSMAYMIEERPSLSLDRDAIHRNGFVPGPWIHEVKNLFLLGELDSGTVDVTLQDGTQKKISASRLKDEILVSRHPHKTVYVTDGSTEVKNSEILLALIDQADLWYSETCFIQADEARAISTKHFTAKFIGTLAAQAKVKRIAPFHFSKRYIEDPSVVLNEVAENFTGEIISLLPEEPCLRL